ncbi:MAG: hypothetical protein AAB642_03175 [Patescibacteria group bacterium]
MLDSFYILKGCIVDKVANSDAAIEWVFLQVMRDYKNNPEVISEACALIHQHRRRLEKALVAKIMKAWAKEKELFSESELSPRPNRSVKHPMFGKPRPDLVIQDQAFLLPSCDKISIFSDRLPTAGRRKIEILDLVTKVLTWERSQDLRWACFHNLTRL